MVVAPLGVLKAGGAYLPLDPAPRRSASAPFEDAGATVLLARPFVSVVAPGGTLPRTTGALESDESRAPRRLTLRVAAHENRRVRDLHVRLDGQAQGRGGEAPMLCNLVHGTSRRTA